MVPLTPASELRDDPAWIEEMLPLFEESCMKDEGGLVTPLFDFLPSHAYNVPTDTFNIVVRSTQVTIET
jgi:hypothetical protein